MSYYNKGDSITYGEHPRFATATIKSVDREKMLITLDGGKVIGYGQVVYHNGRAKPHPILGRYGILSPE